MGSGNAERGSTEIELRGKKYTVLELDLRELGDIANFIKSKYARLYRASAEGMKPKEREAAVREILRTKYTPDELNEEMSEFDVVHYVAFLSLRNNPGVTMENIDKILNQGNLDILVTAMNSFGDVTINPPKVEEETP